MAQFFTKTTLIFTFLIFHSSAFSQLLLPYTFQNDSRYADAEIYIGLVGIYNEEGVWMDMATSTIHPQIGTVQDMPGPEFATSPSGENLYPDIFTKLNDIPNKTINIPHGLAGCRIFISFESPMYLYFHETGGYAGANLQNPNDPNDGIRWEIVELTWADAGLWTNTSRVDAYQYPMGLEVTGYDGAAADTTYELRYNSITSGGSPNIYKKIGELVTHQRILDSWETSVGPAFHGCKIVKVHSLDGEPIIEQPSKIPDFKAGGAFEDYFDAYINDIWTTYSTKTLLLDIGDRGVWAGTVTGDEFNFVDPADGTIATIYGKPSTSDAIEGAGFLAGTMVDPELNLEKYNEDLMIQAQVSAAINRHAIYTDVADGVVQYNHDATRFFVRDPYNEYVSYFHNDTISFESQTYAFAYDDVGDHSSTIQCTYPTDVLVVIGGYGEDTSTPRALAGADVTATDEDENGVESITLDGSMSADRGVIVSHEWLEDGQVIANTAIATLDFTIGTHNVTLRVTDDEGLTDTDEIVVTVIAAGSINGVELIPGCKTDFTVVVTNELSNPSITFVPQVEGYGEPTCLLFYDTNPANVPGVGATAVTPNEPKQILAAEGETVYFYYTYSTGVGEDNSAACIMSFVVGGFNQSPLANPGANQTITLPANSVSLDGTASYDPDGDLITYSWTQVSGPSTATISDASIATPIVSDLTVGTYVFELTVSDGDLDGANQVSVIVNDIVTNVSLIGEGDKIKTYPNPVADQLIIECDATLFNDLVIVDIAGNTLYNQQITSNKMVIDMNNFSTGVYIIKLAGNKNIESKIVVKQ